MIRKYSRHLKKVTGASSLVVLLAACASEESAAKSALRASLKDPDSAQFGDVILVGKSGACIPVNAKNSFGGYSGWQAFALMKLDNEWLPLTASDSMKQCKIVVTKMIEEQTK